VVVVVVVVAVLVLVFCVPHSVESRVLKVCTYLAGGLARRRRR